MKAVPTPEHVLARAKPNKLIASFLLSASIPEPSELVDLEQCYDH